MATFEIKPAAQGISIELTDISANKDQLLESFGECADGKCECSTDEFLKVESIDVRDLGDQIVVNVTTKPGEEIDQSCVTDCLTEMQNK